MKYPKSKKSSVDWMIIVGAIVAVVIGFVILNITSTGLFSGGKNVDYLSSCESKKGTCEPSNDPNQNCFFKSGCPSDKNSNGKIDESEKGNNYCCIPK